MGVVYRAWDTVLERVVALKMMIGEAHTDPAARERFFREARSAAQLTHKNIVTVYDLGEEQGQPYLAMEFLDGEDLQRRLARPDKASVWRKVAIALEICHGMEFAHAHGVIHRDVKPGNIFVTATGGVKILDFGLARFVSSQLTQSNMLLGTINYMAPEQVRGDRADQQSDVFSIGVVLYELFGGRRAFEGDSAASTLYKILQEYPEPLWKIDSGLPRELTAIVDRALAKPRDERYPDVASLRRDLEMLPTLSQHPGPATPWPSTAAAIPPPPGSSAPLRAAAPPPPGSAPVAASAPPAAMASASTPAASGVSPTAPAPPSSPPAAMAPAPRTSRGFWVGAAFGALAIAFVVVWMANRRAEPVASAPAPLPSQTRSAPAAPPAAPAVPATVSAAADVNPRAEPAETAAADRRGVAKRGGVTAEPPPARTATHGEKPVPAARDTSSAPSPPPAITVQPPITTGATQSVPQPAPPAPPVGVSQPAAPAPAIAQPAAPPPPVEPPLSPERANDLLRRYKAALEGRSLEQLKRIWPSLGGAGETAIRQEFQHASRITVDISEPQVTAAASTGRITFVRGYTLVTVDGQRLQSTSEAAMDVRRSGDGWLIDSIRFTPR